jgi:DNA (cytosine-5)-methyltransferase 1|nr:MAG TPA: Modification methylase HhaI [Caudoviricetes sp.]
MPFKCASFFAGVGGIDLGFEQTGKFQTVYANEFDIYPVKTFELNNDIKVDHRSIVDVTDTEVPQVDVYLAGFPCTDISVAGERKGLYEADGTYTRSGLFFEVIRLLEKNDVPVVFFENVKNLVGHDGGKTFQIITDSLKELGYHIKYKVLNAMEYGNVPQNRERIYIVGFKDQGKCEKFKFPDPIPLTTTLNQIINFEDKLDDKYYYTPGKYKGDIYEQLNAAMDDPNTVYQWRRKYVRKNMSGVVPTLTANQGEGGHNVCLVKTKYGIRKMTPHECFNAQGFPADFKLPTDMSESRLYKQAGNSVCVSVIRRIAEEIARVM